MNRKPRAQRPTSSRTKKEVPVNDAAEQAIVEVLPAEEVSDEAASPLPVQAEVDEISPADFVEAEPDLAASESSRDIVPYDPLSAYLREIQRYPLLSKEEEHDLAVKYFTHKDIEAAYKLVSSNLWLVVKIARDYERAVRSLLDLVQEGNIGLMEAVKNFDPYRGVRFPSYAVWWIKAYIIRYVMANWRMVKIGTTQAQRKLFFNLKKEKEKLEREGIFPGPKLLAEKLNVKESEVIEMEQRLGGADVSVDAPLDEDGEANLLSMLSSGSATAEDILSRKEVSTMLLQGLEEFASTLKEKELIIFRQRMLGEEKATLQDISDQLSISRERVRQIENRIREKLKQFLLDRFGAAIENIEFES
ncbi:MAG: RNA polymerase factor sigma-32 [Oligoflexia bacterium]|nr:RNA polymerase factor sigma-32 [Oligoflexia bacterium]